MFESTGMNENHASNFMPIFETFQHMINPYQLLNTPLTIALGMYQGVFLGELLVGWTACSTYFGLDYISLILMTYGLSDAVSSLCAGILVRHTGFQFFEGIITIGNVVVYCAIITAPDDTPFNNSHSGLFIMAGLYGIVTGVWRMFTLSNVYYIQYI